MLNEHSFPHDAGQDNVGEPAFHAPGFDSPAFDAPGFNDAVFARLGRELKESAERLGGLSPNRTFAQLASEAARRRRLRITRQASAGGAVSVLLLIVWLGAGQWSRRDSVPSPVAHVGPKTEQSVWQSPVLIQANSPARSHLAADRADPSVALSNFDQESKPLERHQKPATVEKATSPISVSGPMPVLVHMTQSDGEVIVAPGVIVPEHTEPLDWSQLGPQERWAVWQVLNLDSEKSSSERPTI